MGNQLPNNVFDRIGTVAVGIQQHFIDEGLVSSRNDKYIWNNISFVIAFLLEFNVCSVVDNIHFQLGFKHLYKDEDESFDCGVWIREGVSFYKKQINDMRLNIHSLPDVIIYNLLNPDIDKKPLSDISIFDVDILASISCWEYILNLIDKFFLSDPNFKELPRGC